MAVLLFRENFIHVEKGRERIPVFATISKMLTTGIDTKMVKIVVLEALREEVGKDMGAFYLVCHVAFDQPALTRKECANNVHKRNYFGKYSETIRKIS